MRRRLWTALGASGWLLAGAAGCEETATMTAADAAHDHAAADAGDGTVSGDLGADVAADAPAIDRPDVATADAFDAVADVAVDRAPGEVSVPDAGATDAPAADTVPPGEAGTDAAVVTDVVVPACPPTAAMTQCLTLDEARRNILFPPGDILPPPDGGYTDRLAMATTEPDGCYAPRFISEGCCSRASGVVRRGEQCCYSFCVMACCGRPLVLDGVARVAEESPGTAWSGAASAEDPALDAVTARELARAWREDARMEHASVASFARFTLGLLSAGAPPELVRDAATATADEVEHARRCFALATRYDGRAVGPAGLDATGGLDDASLAGQVRAAVREGCVGETCSALLAMAQRERATDLAVRSALGRIIEDETAHAELSWRFVAWALAAGGEDVRRAAREAFDAATADPPVRAVGPRGAVDEALWAAHGRLTAAQARKVLHDAVALVVRPTSAALLAAQRAEAPVVALPV